MKPAGFAYAPDGAFDGPDAPCLPGQLPTKYVPMRPFCFALNGSIVMTLKFVTGRIALPTVSNTLQMPAPLGAAATCPPCEYCSEPPGGSESATMGAGVGSIAARNFPLAPRSLSRM